MISDTQAPPLFQTRLRTAHIAVVIPCYRVEKQIGWVVERIPEFVRTVIAVDDCSPDGTARVLRDLCRRHQRLTVITHATNKGVGGAVVSGYQEALRQGADVVVKIDGDAQMDPLILRSFISPILEMEADYVKGNRFHRFIDSKSMPVSRRIGNLGLSFLLRASTGYWNLLDPTNGYTAISRAMLRCLDLDDLESRYLFESSMLAHLYRARARVVQLPMMAKYGDEESSLRVSRVSCQLSWALTKWLFARVFRTYFWDGFGLVSIFLFFGSVLLATGTGIGAYHWFQSMSHGTPATAGTVMLASMPVILGFELLLNALVLDVQNVPSVPAATIEQLGAQDESADPSYARTFEEEW